MLGSIELPRTKGSVSQLFGEYRHERGKGVGDFVQQLGTMDTDLSG